MTTRQKEFHNKEIFNTSGAHTAARSAVLPHLGQRQTHRTRHSRTASSSHQSMCDALCRHGIVVYVAARC